MDSVELVVEKQKVPPVFRALNTVFENSGTFLMCSNTSLQKMKSFKIDSLVPTQPVVRTSVERLFQDKLNEKYISLNINFICVIDIIKNKKFIR